jgi:cytochrome c oxidase subunit 4
MSDLTTYSEVAREEPLKEGSHAEIGLVWLALMGLLVATLLVHFVPLGSLAIIAALGFAGAKTWLVMRHYMHLKYRPLLVALFAGAAFVWLAILFGLSLTDYLTRHWILIGG